MAKLTLTDITSGYDSPTRINANNALIETALENTLSRDGTDPNFMLAGIDMNSFRIINLGAPTQLDDAVRLRDLSEILPSGSVALSQAIGTIGLTAVTGVSSLVARADSLPPLSQAIVPTWTGLHTFSAGARASSGSAATPTWSFTTNTNQGLYTISATAMGVSVGGVLRLTFSTTALTSTVPIAAPAGTVSAPGIITTSVSTGLYAISTSEMAFSAAGSRAGGWRDPANGGIYTTDFTGTAYSVGYKLIPQNSQSGNYTAVRQDEAKHLYHPSGAGPSHTYTVPSNASVPYPIGTVLTVVNRDSNNLLIAITSDTMIFANSISTGTRTLAQNGVATIFKTGATEWLISGPGLT